MKKLNNTIKVIGLLTITAGLSACMPHLTQQQCTTMNWYQLGFTDGSLAKNQRDLSRDIQDCAKFNVKVSTQKYSKGWRAGTRQYCQPNTAYQLGVNGRNYNHICPADLSNEFNKAWHRGLRRYCIPSTAYRLGHAGKPMPGFCGGSQIIAFRNAYQRGFNLYLQTKDVQSQVNNTNGQINNTRHKIQAKRNRINHLQIQLASGTDQHGNRIPWPVRLDMQQQITFLNKNIYRLKNQLRRLNRQLVVQQQRLAGLRSA